MPTWDPCTELDDATIAEFGLDPATEANSDIGSQLGCAWDYDDGNVSLQRDGQSVDDFRARTDLFPVEDLEIGGSTTLSLQVDEVNSGGCLIPLAVPAGTIVVIVTLSFDAFEAGADSCAMAEEVAVQLEPLLPD